jgi:hypothetical protein
MKHLLSSMFVVVCLIVSSFALAENLPIGIDNESPAFKAAKKLISSSFKPDNSDEQDKMCFNKNPYIYVFISSSMPRYLLKEFAEESFKLDENGLATVDFVLRGVPDMGLEKFRELINPSNKNMVIRIDPFLYNRLSIIQVPVVVVDRAYAIDSPSSILSAINLIESDAYDRLANEMQHF